MTAEQNFLLSSIVALLCYLSGFWFLFRIPLCKINYEHHKYPKLSIIIPARNEESNIGTLLDSINNQSFKPDEVIVVNDSSTDRTKEISLIKNSTVIDSKPLPQGWLGKPWACYQGAQNASGELYFFLDSDTELEEHGLKKIVHTYMNLAQNNTANIVLSIAPYHKVKKLYEEFSAMFNIIMMSSMNAFTPIKNAELNGLFGQSLVVSREIYYKINGHESVKNRILENMFMAEKFKSAGVILKCFGGKGCLSFRMYNNGLKDLINGWSKSFATGATQIQVITLLNIIFWISGGFIVLLFLLLNMFENQNLLLWITLYTAFSLQIYWMLERIGSFRVVSSIFYPIHLVFFCILFTRSLVLKLTNKSIQWKEREVKS